VVSPVTRSPGARASVQAPVTPLITTSNTFDFGTLGGSDAVIDLGASHPFTIAGVGTITATASANHHVTDKGASLLLEPERGLGLCVVDGAACDNDEVGTASGNDGTLTLAFSGFAAGTTVNELTFGSVQAGEGVAYAISTNGGANFGAVTTVIPNPEAPGDILTIDLGSPISTTNLQIRFSAATGGINDNDYTVRTVVTELTTNPLQGRMTGGGVKATNDDGDPVTFGVEIHCDITLSNNIEINWPGHKWHLTKPILTSDCENQDNDAPPPASPIDTFKGTAVGELDGVGGSTIAWDFEDHGEPGTNDKVELTVHAPGSSTVVMHIALQNISIGNWQMHYDQPHGFKP
jgi:hypothetical protein